MSETITINVDESVARRFRKAAGMKYGRRKGYLGKAVTNALETWAEKQDKSLEAQFMELLEKGFNGKKWKFDRDEAHER